MSVMTRQTVRCRRIAESDIDALFVLFARLFPPRPDGYWRRAFERLAARPVLGDYPRFGYMLESGGAPVGALLTIFSQARSGSETYVRCNLSSWCVEPLYACYGAMLVNIALKFRGVTYTDVTPARHTLETIVNLGFSCYSRGIFASVPALAIASEPAEVAAFQAGADYRGLLSPEEIALLAEHAAFGCMTLVCDAGKDIHPFVFLRRRVRFAGLDIPCAHMCFCRDEEDFRRFARPLGRALAARGAIFALTDANQPIAGVPGRYFPGRNPKYRLGPVTPRLGDLAWSETTLFEPGYC